MKRKIIQWLMILSLIFPLFSGCGGIAYADDESAEQGVQVSDLLGYWSGWAYKGVSDIQKSGKDNDTIRKGFSGRNAFMVWSFMSPGSKGTGSSLTGAEISFTQTNVTYKSLVANMPSNGKSKYLTNDVKPMFMYRYVLEQNGLLTPANNAAAGMFVNVGRMVSGLLLYAVVLADKIVQSALKISLGLIATLNPFVGLAYITGNSSVLNQLNGKKTQFTNKTAIKGNDNFSIKRIWGSITADQKDGNGLIAVYKALVAITIVIYIVLMAVGIGKAIMMGGGQFGKSVGKTVSKYFSRIIILFAGPILMGLGGAYLINKVAGMGLTSLSSQTSSIIYGNFVNTQQWAVNSRFALPDKTYVSKGKGKGSNSDTIRNLATSGHLYASTNPSNLTKQYILQLNAKNAGIAGASQAMGGKSPSFGTISKDLIGPYMMGSTFSRQDLDGAMIASISKDKDRAYAESDKSAIGQSQVFTYSKDDLKYDSFEKYLSNLADGKVTEAANGGTAKDNAEKIYSYTYGGGGVGSWFSGKKGVYNALFISDGGLTIGKTKKKGTKFYKQTNVTSKDTGSHLSPGTNADLAGLSTAGAMNLLSITKSNSGTSYVFPVSMVGGQTGATSSLTKTVSLANVNNALEGFCKIVLIVLKAIFGISITFCVLALLANTAMKSVMDTFKHGLQLLKGDIQAIQVMLKDLIGMLLQMLLGFMLILATNSISDIVESLINSVTGAFVPSGTAIVSHGIVMGASVSTAIIALSYIIQSAVYFWLIKTIFKDFNLFMRSVATMFDRAIEKMGMNPGSPADPALNMLQKGQDKFNDAKNAMKDGLNGMLDDKDAEDKRKAGLSDDLDNIDDPNKEQKLKDSIDNGEDKSKHGKSEIAKMAKEKSDKLKEENDKLAKKHQDIEDRLKDATNPQEIDKLKDEKKANEAEQKANEEKMKKLGELGDRAAQHKKDADKAKSTLGGRLKQTMNPSYADAKATYDANMRDLDKDLANKRITPAQYAKAKQALKDEYRKQTASPLAKSLAKKALTGGGLASEELLRKAINNPNGALAKALDMATGGQFSEALKQGKPMNRQERQQMLQKLVDNKAPLSKMTEVANSFVPKKQAAEASKNFAAAKANADSVAGETQEVIERAQEAVANGTATDAQKELVHDLSKMPQALTTDTKTMNAIKSGDKKKAAKAIIEENKTMLDKAVKDGRVNDAISIMKRINNETSQANIDVPKEIGHPEIQKMIEDVSRADAFQKSDMVSQPAVGELAKAGIAPTTIHKTNVPQSRNTVLEAAFGQEVTMPKTGGTIITNEMIAKAPAATRAGLKEMQNAGVKINFTGKKLQNTPSVKEVKNAVIGLTTGYQGNAQQVLGGLDKEIIEAQANGQNIVQTVKKSNIKMLAADAAGVNLKGEQAKIVASHQTPAAVLAAQSVVSSTAPINVDLETSYQLHGNNPSTQAAEKAWGTGGSVLIKGLEQSISVKNKALEIDPNNKELRTSLETQTHHLEVLKNMAQTGAMPITQEEVSAVAESYQAIDPSQTQTTIKHTAEKAVEVGRAIQSHAAAASSSSVVGASTDTTRYLAGNPKPKAPRKRNKLQEIQDNARGGSTFRERLQKQNEEYKLHRLREEDSIFNPFLVASDPTVAKYEAERARKHARDHADRFEIQRKKAKKAAEQRRRDGR